MKTQKMSLAVSAFVILSFFFAISTSYAQKDQSPKKPVPKAAVKQQPKAPLAPAVKSMAKNPYAGAIVIDAATGKILFEDNPDAKGYPASVIKLMVLLIITEGVEAKQISLEDNVTVTAEASRMGGSQVYLKENEVFSVNELLYALMVQSANDAAVTLALHYSGSKEGFVDVMNKRAQELGMKDTIFHSVHGLPPGKGQQPDVSTPRDIAKLCQELLKHPDILRYTSTKERPFRMDSPTPFIMRNHNHLLGTFVDCDGFKTGYFAAGGFSIAATAVKKGMRAIVVILGSIDRKVRDAKARELLARGLQTLVASAPPPALAPVVQEAKTPADAEGGTGPETEKKDVIEIKKDTLIIAGAVILGVIILIIVMYSLAAKNKRSKKRRGDGIGFLE
ncbi:Serine-type D-Ala-D-Ala carboxypeptidase (modular protein) [uncultured Desulfobacterium sp.]|uniref:Serine-type D-Ala-D-Ala carboxypeptidase (Modular protein) n=1 Tax=uncultured Desulfobacterium sp. TaxID=201089 RepID=A0A445MTB6_9BACT|nr:Serine-type D-Ala-D-Ala carboxypeptidase (modular protein) [uncultured Desulfobacterium sp.]